MQPSLFQSERRAPSMDGWHYVPAVQNKSGELQALKEMSASAWDRMTPVVNLVGPRTQSKPLRAQTIAGWVKRVEDTVGDHLIYLDVLRLDPTRLVETSEGRTPVLAHIYAEARKRRMRFVPVTRVGDTTKGRVDVVAGAAREDGNGVALRFPFLTMAIPPGTTRTALIRKVLDKLECDISCADLLIDLEYLDPDDDLDAPQLAESLDAMAAIGSWRSIVVLGSSIPRTLSCVAEGTIGTLRRREWELWTQLGVCGLSRLPAFGDYAIQHPYPPAEGGGPGMRANIRYTTAKATLVARGKGSVLQEGKEQYQELCQQLVAQAAFSGRSYTWGDRLIQDCANGTIEPGAQAMWRGVGTSHHLQFMIDLLQQRRPSQADLSREDLRPGRRATQNCMTHEVAQLSAGSGPQEFTPKLPT